MIFSIKKKNKNVIYELLLLLLLNSQHIIYRLWDVWKDRWLLCYSEKYCALLYGEQF